MEIHRRAVIVLSCSPFALIALVASWYGWVNFKAKREADALIAKLEQAGHPTVIEKLYPTVENPDNTMMGHPAMVAELALPDDEKLSRIAEATFGHRIDGLAEYGIKAANRHIGEFQDVRTCFEPVRHETPQQAAAELLDELTPELARLDGLLEAFARPESGWSVRREASGPDQFEAIDFEGLMEVLQFARFMSEAALLHLAGENPDAAVPLLGGLFEIHRHFTSPPQFLLGSLVSAVVLDQIAGLIQHGIAHGQWEEHHLATFAARLDGLAPEATFVSAISGELTFGADHLQQMLAGKSDLGSHGFDFQHSDPDDFEDYLQEFWMAARPRGAAMQELTASTELLYRLGLHLDGARRNMFRLREIEEFNRIESREDTDSYVVSVAVMVLKNSAQRYFEVKASHALLLTGIALERHRLAHGTHPQTLAALVPKFLTEAPLDPCDGQPLRYRLQSDGSPVVWSIGIDGIDEGGKPHRNRESGDRVWVTRPLEGFDKDELNR